MASIPTNHEIFEAQISQRNIVLVHNDSFIGFSTKLNAEKFIDLCKKNGIKKPAHSSLDVLHKDGWWRPMETCEMRGIGMFLSICDGAIWSA